jgi:hypothetical protein
VTVDIDPTLSDGELEDELQYPHLLENDSSGRPYIDENGEMADFHRPPNEPLSTLDDIILFLERP